MLPTQNSGPIAPSAMECQVARPERCVDGGHHPDAWKRDRALNLTAHHQRWARLCLCCDTGEDPGLSLAQTTSILPYVGKCSLLRPTDETQVSLAGEVGLTPN
jgi:hypothetical protein